LNISFFFLSRPIIAKLIISPFKGSSKIMLMRSKRSVFFDYVKLEDDKGLRGGSHWSLAQSFCGSKWQDISPFALAFGIDFDKALCARLLAHSKLVGPHVETPGGKSKNSRILNSLVFQGHYHRQGVGGNDRRGLDMGVKVNVPFGVDKKKESSLHIVGLSFIVPILKVDFELTTLKSILEPIDAATCQHFSYSCLYL
jgi:hypothetical protein